MKNLRFPEKITIISIVVSLISIALGVFTTGTAINIIVYFFDPIIFGWLMELLVRLLLFVFFKIF